MPQRNKPLYEYSYLRRDSCEDKVPYSAYIVVYPPYIMDFLCAINSRARVDVPRYSVFYLTPPEC